MTKSLIIEFDPKDENLLLALFKKLKVKSMTVSLTNNNDDLEEQAFVQNALHQKYVETGEWAQKTDDERQDLALAEMMRYEQQRSDYKIMTAQESETFYTSLKKQLYADTAD